MLRYVCKIIQWQHKKNHILSLELSTPNIAQSLKTNTKLI